MQFKQVQFEQVKFKHVKFEQVKFEQVKFEQMILLLFRHHFFEAGVTFDNSFFDNYFDFLRQLENGSFLGPVFVHVTGRSKN